MCQLFSHLHTRQDERAGTLKVVGDDGTLMKAPLLQEEQGGQEALGQLGRQLTLISPGGSGRWIEFQHALGESIACTVGI